MGGFASDYDKTGSTVYAGLGRTADRTRDDRDRTLDPPDTQTCDYQYATVDALSAEIQAIEYSQLSTAEQGDLQTLTYDLRALGESLCTDEQTFAYEAGRIEQELERLASEATSDPEPDPGECDAILTRADTLQSQLNAVNYDALTAGCKTTYSEALTLIQNAEAVACSQPRAATQSLDNAAGLIQQLGRSSCLETVDDTGGTGDDTTQCNALLDEAEVIEGQIWSFAYGSLTDTCAQAYNQALNEVQTAKNVACQDSAQARTALDRAIYLRDQIEAGSCGGQITGGSGSSADAGDAQTAGFGLGTGTIVTGGLALALAYFFFK